MNKNIRNILATALLIVGNAVAVSAQNKYVGGDISLLPTNETWGARYLDKDAGPSTTFSLSSSKKEA